MDEAWNRVRDAMRARRIALRLTQTEAATIAGMSQGRWQLYENSNTPQRPRPATQRGIEEALRWREGAWQMLLDGADPAALEAATPPVSATPLPVLPPEVGQVMDTLLEGVREIRQGLRDERDHQHTLLHQIEQLSGELAETRERVSSQTAQFGALVALLERLTVLQQAAPPSP